MLQKKINNFDRKISLQEQYAPQSICFGCGPANNMGLKIKSYVEEALVVCTWTPESYHMAFPGMINGGIIGSILDCHCNWSAAWHLYNSNNRTEFPCTVTAKYSISLNRPTPINTELKLVAKIDKAEGSKAYVSATLEANGEVCASCEGLFVAVKPGHPAYHRW